MMLEYQSYLYHSFHEYSNFIMVTSSVVGFRKHLMALITKLDLLGDILTAHLAVVYPNLLQYIVGALSGDLHYKCGLLKLLTITQIITITVANIHLQSPRQHSVDKMLHQ